MVRACHRPSSFHHQARGSNTTREWRGRVILPSIRPGGQTRHLARALIISDLVTRIKLATCVALTRTHMSPQVYARSSLSAERSTRKLVFTIQCKLISCGRPIFTQIMRCNRDLMELRQIMRELSEEVQLIRDLMVLHECVVAP